MRVIDELRRRKVFRVAVAYGVTAWLIAQIIAVINEPLSLPDWFDTTILVVLIIGFPIAMILTWGFELTPDGVERTRPSDEPGEQPPPPGRHWLDYAILSLLAIAVGWMIFRGEFGAGERATSGQQPAGEAAEVGLLPNSIAVLPFDNLSPNPNDAYFAAGLHEEVLNQLAKINDLSVIARTSVLVYADTRKQVPAIAAELNVGAVLEGSVRYAGNRVRITAQLIDGKTGAHLWSESYDRHLDDIFGIQLDIADQITRAMKVEFSLSEREAVGSSKTDSAQAYALYTKARSLLADFRSTRGVHAALDAAIAIDPQFASALAFKAVLHSYEAVIDFDESVITRASQEKNFRLAARFAHRAIAIDPNVADAYLALRNIAESERQWEDAMAYIEKALSLSPGDPLLVINYAADVGDRGNHAEMLRLFARLIALDPLNMGYICAAGAQMAWTEQWAEAEQYYRRCTALSPNMGVGYAGIAWVASFTGQRDLALEMARKAETLPLRSGDWSDILQAYYYLGRPDDVRRIYLKVLAEYEAGTITVDDLWQAHYLMGDVDTALDLLEEVVETNFPSKVCFQTRWRWRHPFFDRMREEPRFRDLLVKLGAIEPAG